MPVRTKAVAAGLRAFGLKMSFNSLTATATVNGERMTRDIYDERFWDPADEVYERVVDSIDWNRVFLEASARHIALKHEVNDWPGYGDVCPECLCEALLVGDTIVDWKKTPNVPRLSETDS